MLHWGYLIRSVGYLGSCVGVELYQFFLWYFGLGDFSQFWFLLLPGAVFFS